INHLYVFHWRRPQLRPRWSHFSAGAARRLLGMGGLFLVLQISMAFAFTSDNLVAAQVLGPEAVTQYSVPYRLFGIFITMLMVILGPLWPAYGEAASRGDVDWVVRTLKRSLFLGGSV